jgi:hypothetical protein
MVLAIGTPTAEARSMRPQRHDDYGDRVNEAANFLRARGGNHDPRNDAKKERILALLQEMASTIVRLKRDLADERETIVVVNYKGKET